MEEKEGEKKKNKQENPQKVMDSQITVYISYLS